MKRWTLSLFVMVAVLLGAALFTCQAKANLMAEVVFLRGGYSGAEVVQLQGEGYILEAAAGMAVVGMSSGEGYEVVSGYTPLRLVERKIYLPVIAKR